jgi:hypothetical protein
MRGGRGSKASRSDVGVGRSNRRRWALAAQRDGSDARG